MQVAIEEQVPAGPHAVFAAWTSADHLARWWWPHIPDTTYSVDFRIGGRFEIVSPAAGIGVQGEFVSIDEPRMLEMTWRWLTDGVSEVEETVRIDFTPDGESTQVTVTHELAGGAGDGGDQRQGWEHVLTRLSESFRAD